jgi:two-component system, sensor histidine kinase ChiS
MFRLFIFSVFLVLLSSSLNAQEIHITQHSIQDGLPQSNVNCLYQDHMGYIWMGTRDGFCKFDGLRFKVYNQIQGYTYNFITSIIEDKEKNLWLSTFRGMIKFNRQNFTVFNKQNNLLPESVVRTSVYDSINNILWIGTETGIFYFKNNKFNVFEYDKELPGKNILYLYLTSDKKLIICTDKGVGIFSDNIMALLKDPLLEKPVNYAFEDDEKTLWFGTQGNGLLKLQDGKLGKKDIKELKSENIWAIIQKNNHYLIVGSDDGIFVLKDGLVTEHISTENGLSDNKIRSLLYDKQNNLWAGTLTGGVNIIKEGCFRSFFPKEINRNTFIRALAEDNQKNIWVGNDEGDIFFLKDAKLKRYETGIKINKAIRALFFSPGNILWIGTYGEGIIRISNGKSVKLNPPGLENSRIICINQNKDGRMFFGTEKNGLYVYDGNKFSIFNKENSILPGILRGIICTDSGTAYLTSSTGLYLYNHGTIEKVETGKLFDNNDFRASCQDKSGKIYVSIDNKIYFLEDGKISNLPENLQYGRSIISLTKGNNEILYCGHYDGLTAINLKQNTSRHFNQYDGFKNIECSYNTLLEQKNYLYIGTSRGLTLFEPDKEVIQNLQKVFLHITGIKKFNIPLSPINDHEYFTSFDSLNNLPVNLVLPYNKNHLSFNFTALDYIAPERINYRYKLKGFDNEWQPSTKASEVVYSNLSPGRYIFIVEASNTPLFQNTISKSFSFTIKYPFWEETWFYVIEISFFLILLGGSIILKKRRIKTQVATAILFIIFLLVIEIVNLYLENYLDRFTAGIPILKIVSNVGIALSLSPIEKIAKKLG